MYLYSFLNIDRLDDAKFFFDNGADPYIKNSDNECFFDRLMFRVFTGAKNKEAVKLLRYINEKYPNISYLTDMLCLSICSNDGKFFVYGSNHKTTNLLLEFGANPFAPFAKQENGLSFFDKARQSGSTDPLIEKIVKKLSEQRLDAMITKNIDGFSSISI